MKKNLFLFAPLILTFISCSSDNVKDFYNSKDCNTENVTFSETINSIIDQNCKSCHYSGNESGVILESYANIKHYVDNGELLGVIKHQPGYPPMPQGGKLDDCTIAKIEAWINNGALDN